MSYLIYDLEIENAIPSKKEPMVPGVRYCEGWGDRVGMGVAIVAAYDSAEDRFRIFDKHTLGDLHDLTTARGFRVGWNNILFDDKVLDAHDVYLQGEPVDLLQLIRKKVGIVAGWSLEAVAERIFGTTKDEHGSRMPVLWQAGRVGEVVDHALEDVRMTRDILIHAHREGLPTPDGKTLRIDLPPLLGAALRGIA